MTGGDLLKRYSGAVRGGIFPKPDDTEAWYREVVEREVNAVTDQAVARKRALQRAIQAIHCQTTSALTEANDIISPDDHV